MNPLKTEFIWFGSRVNLQKIITMTSTSSVRVTNDDIRYVNVVRDLGVTLDSDLSM